MVAKLLLGLVILAIVISLAVLGTFWYLKNVHELEHEKEMRQLERDEALFEQDSIDRQLEREKKR